MTIKIAGICIGIDPVSEGWEYFCRDYMTDEEADFLLSATEEDLVKEQNRAVEYWGEGNYRGFELEKLWVYRRIAETIPRYDAFLIHAASVRVDENAYMFLGPSGAGKTTHTRFWKRCFGDRMKVINDDKPIVRVNGDDIIVYGSPWCGKEGWENNISAPLKSAFWINQAEENSIEKNSKETSWDILMNQIYRSYDTDNTQRTLKLLDKVIKETDLYTLRCNKTIEAAELAYNTSNQG